MIPPTEDARLVTWLASLRQISAAVAAGGDLGALLDSVAACARDLLGFEFCAVFLPDTSGSILRLRGASGLSPEYVDAVNETIRIPVTGTAPAGRAYTSRQPVVMRDVAAERDFDPWAQHALSEGFSSLLAMPLIAEGEAIGTMTGYHRAVHDFTPQELSQMAHLADHAAIGVTSARIMQDLRGANSELTRQWDLLTRSDDIHRRFLDVTLSLGGMDGIAATLATLLQRPVLIEDRSGSPMAARRLGADFPDAGTRRILPKDGDVATPMRHDLGGASVWSSTVQLAQEGVARLWVGEGSRAIDDLDIRAIEHATLATALEMMRRRNSAEVDHRYRADLLTDLLEGADSNLAERSLSLGHDLSAPHIALVAQPVASGSSSITPLRRAFDAASARAQALPTPRPLVAIHRGILVVLWPTSTTDDGTSPAGDDGAIDRAFTEIRRSAGEMTAIVTTGRSYRSPAHALKVALGALRLAQHSGRGDALVRIPDLGLSGMLLQLRDTAELVAYVEEKLAPVTRYDDAHGTSLVDTLHAHVRANLDAHSTASQLNIHVNTVRQRLRRVEELTGADLRRPGDLLEFTTALTVRDVVMRSSPAS